LDKSLSGLIYLMAGAGTGSFAAAADRVGVLIDQQLSGDRRVLAGKK
jgi:hypothetical protein